MRSGTPASKAGCCTVASHSSTAASAARYGPLQLVCVLTPPMHCGAARCMGRRTDNEHVALRSQTQARRDDALAKMLKELIKAERAQKRCIASGRRMNLRNPHTTSPLACSLLFLPPVLQPYLARPSYPLVSSLRSSILSAHRLQRSAQGQC